MEPSNEFNLCEIYAKLSECTEHLKPLEFLCTSKDCPKKRLSCNKCLFGSYHNSCISKTVLLDDILTPKCFSEPKETLKNWIDNEKVLKFICDFHISFKTKNIDIKSQEITSVFEEKWFQIELEIKNRISEILENTHMRLLEQVKQHSKELSLYRMFDSHINPEKLLEIMQTVPLNQLDSALENFFSVSVNDFYETSLKNDSNSNVMLNLDKIGNILTSQVAKISLDLEEKISEMNSDLQNNQKKLINIERFHGLSMGMNYGNQRTDCITFKTNLNVQLNGISVFKSEIKDACWNILTLIIKGERTSGVVLHKELHRLKNENVEAKAVLSFSKPIWIKKQEKYTVYLLINGADTYKGIDGKSFIKEDNLEVTFSETIHSEKDPKNATGIYSGQIPNLIFSLKN